jgi:NAD(P)-dependent dehydrogenase (short-subunit alcohol dehydrogenase family)
MTTPFDLSGRVIWVTGASRGLGRAITTSLVDAGAYVAVTSRSAADLKQLAAGLDTDNVGVYPGSVSESPAIDAILAKVLSAHGRIDGLVNCAGISPTFAPSDTLTDGDWAHVIDVNLTGTFRCCRSAGRAMLAQGSGSIVNVSSVHATVGSPRIAAYAASKGGVHALTKTLAVEWASRGVRVNALAPGYFQTDLSAGLLKSKHGDRIRAAIPMGRIGAPTELGATAVYLMSEASAYVTGTVVSVDGGWQAW